MGFDPFFAKTPRLTYQTNNARSELAAKATFRDPWRRGHRRRRRSADQGR
jgi:hypothetical protein